MRARRAAQWAAVGLLTATLVRAASGEEPCASAVDWRRVDEGTFSFELPRTLVRAKVQGTDSQIGAFESQSMRVAYDYGSWLLWLGDELQKPGPHQESVVVDGHKATIISASRDLGGPNQYRYARAIQFELPPAEHASQNRYLTVTVRFNDECGDAVSRRIVGSILFR